MRGDGSREEERTVAPSLARRETVLRAREQKKNEEVGETRAPNTGRWGVYGNFSFGETVMHVSPISVTKRLLAAFCPRDNSLSFFMTAPISQLRNYSRKVADTLRNVENACRTDIRL